MDRSSHAQKSARWNYLSIPQKSGNGEVILSCTLLCMWWLIHAGIKVNPLQVKEALWIFLITQDIFVFWKVCQRTDHIDKNYTISPHRYQHDKHLQPKNKLLTTYSAVVNLAYAMQNLYTATREYGEGCLIKHWTSAVFGSENLYYCQVTLCLILMHLKANCKATNQNTDPRFVFLSLMNVIEMAPMTLVSFQFQNCSTCRKIYSIYNIIAYNIEHNTTLT